MMNLQNQNLFVVQSHGNVFNLFLDNDAMNFITLKSPSYYKRISPIPIKMFGGGWFYEWISNGEKSVQE
jgi:hypothetical protein